MNHTQRVVRLAVAVLASAAALTTVATGATAQSEHRPRGDGDLPAESSAGSSLDEVLAWYDVTRAAVAAAAIPVQAPNSAIWATSWTAADRATRRARPQLAALAAAQALHDTLASLVPAATGDLDAALATTVSHFPQDRSAAVAVRAGQRAAARTLQDRAGDGLTLADVNIPYTPPVGPGFWSTTTTGQPAIQAGFGQAEPYRLRSARQVRVPAPPALGSARYRRDLAEVRAYGAASSPVRTQAQTDVALFWEQSSLAAYTQLLRGALAQLADRRSTAARVHLVATFHQATTDAQIVVYRAKYRFQRWRPLTAIHEADLTGTVLSDGDPATVPDPTWTSLFAAPLHPEYPSGHAAYAGAATVVLDRLAGPPSAPVTATSATAPGQTRSYPSWATVLQENIDGRVWEGVHFRTSDTVAARVGAKVAAVAVRHW
jgi:hypothetical protein